MAVKDIASDLFILPYFSGSISSNGDNFGLAADTADIDEGMLAFFVIDNYTDGSYTLTIQESDTSGGVFTDINQDKYVNDSGQYVGVNSQTAYSYFPLAGLGFISTKRFLKAKITASGVTVGADIRMYFIGKTEYLPYV